MKYSFDKMTDRKNTSSLKWDGMTKIYGTNDLLPMWVADMDFEMHPKIKKSYF